MDFQHMVRAFVKLSAQAQEKPRDYTLEEVRKEKDEALDEGVSLANQVEGLKELREECGFEDRGPRAKGFAKGFSKGMKAGCPFQE